MFLSRSELATLTGRTRPRAQARVLADRGIRFFLDGDGRPVVLRSELERTMLGGPVKREPRLRLGAV